MQSILNFYNRMDEIRGRFNKIFQRPLEQPKPAQNFQKVLNEAIDRKNPELQAVKVDIKGVASEGKYGEYINRASKTFNVPENLIKSVIKQESNYDPNAVSHKGAMGLMQLMPDTAQRLNVADPFNPEENIMGGTNYLRNMMNRFDGDIVKALAAYNAGPEALNAGKIPNYPETQNYVKKVINSYLQNSGL